MRSAVGPSEDADPRRMPRVRELAFIRSGRLAWRDRDAPILSDPGDAIVRPFIAARCDGDTLPIHRPVSRLMQAGIAVRALRRDGLQWPHRDGLKWLHLALVSSAGVILPDVGV